MYAILLMKSLATGSSSLTVFVSYIPSLYFLLSTFIPHLLRFFYRNSRQDLSRLILALAAYVCRKHVRAKMMCWHHYEIFWLVP